MAKVKKNVVIEGLSGRIGNLVFRLYGDQTVVSSMPVHDPKREPTPGEAALAGTDKGSCFVGEVYPGQ